jgi:hypothetical protein
MKKLIAILFLVILIPMASGAVEDGNVVYAGGTVAGLKDGSIGKLNTSSTSSLMFDSAGVSLVIQYARRSTRTNIRIHWRGIWACCRRWR